MKTTAPPGLAKNDVTTAVGIVPAREQNAEAASGTDFAPGIDAAFPQEFAERDCALECVQGEVPDFVRGQVDVGRGPEPGRRRERRRPVRTDDVLPEVEGRIPGEHPAE